MRDYVDIGSSPCDEECVQVEPTGAYVQAMREECRRYIDCIREHCGEEQGSAALRVKGNPHDFGTYYEVVCSYDDNDELGANYAYHVEEHAPARWDGTGAKQFTSELPALDENADIDWHAYLTGK